MPKLLRLIKNNIREDLSKSYIVYHSSNYKFNEFDISMVSNLNGDMYGKGIYFAGDKEYAMQFGKYLYKCSITLSNPLNLLAMSRNDKLKKLTSNQHIPNDKVDDITSLIDQGAHTTVFRYIRKYLPFKDLKNEFDGIIGASEESGLEFVVYDPKNIKILNVSEII